MRIDSIGRPAVCTALFAALLAGCGGGSHHGGGSHNAGPASVSLPAPPAAPRHIQTSPCSPSGAAIAKVPFPQQPGVYRAGPLALVAGEDLAQWPKSELAGGSGAEAIAVLTGDRPVSVMVDPGSAGRFSLQFANPTSAAQAANGEAAVRFAACGQRIHRFFGGITFRRQGCALLWVRPTGQVPIPMLIPIGSTLRGCPTKPSRRTLGAGAKPALGIACRRTNTIRCSSVEVGVSLKPAAELVTVQIAGRLVTLTPPATPGHLWSGYLNDVSFTRGPMDLHLPVHQKLWVGKPSVHLRVRLTVFSTDGRVASAEFAVLLQPGFG